jgi:hypothetical protein
MTAYRRCEWRSAQGFCGLMRRFEEGDQESLTTRRTINTMAVRLAHEARSAFHRFQLGSKSSRARLRVGSSLESGSSLWRHP